MEPIDKIIKVLEDFGMSGVKAAEAMGITHATFRQKKNENSIRHTFNEKNYQDLVLFIKNKASEL
ncbi:hypothetical protein [Flavobacterium hungaricum]|uniref:DNA binding HTH domain-containing protein n=1 Tax=Flavobacterium hungaricum TaxID=2082725 RepID=A0ABR9TRG2_9FLAO|nr:hypothetical protein [Flavobacterium hungaricum]MBE8727967.1 hypothetical protein [Flavobacterium hungaricum]